MSRVVGIQRSTGTVKGQEGSARIGILAILVVSVIGLMSMGYGLWNEVLTVQGTAHTGSVLAEWSSDTGRAPFTDDDGSFDNSNWDDGENGSPNEAPETYDGNGPASSADPTSIAPNASRSDKDVGVCTVSQQTDLEGRDKTLNVAAENAYASYWCTTHAYAKNSGSIPMKLQDILLHDAIVISPGNTIEQSVREGEVWCYDADLITSAVEVLDENTPCPEIDGNPLEQAPEDYDLQIIVLASYDCYIGYQMDPAPSPADHAQCPLAFHVQDGAEEQDGHSLTLEFFWVQWNEFVPE